MSRFWPLGCGALGSALALGLVAESRELGAMLAMLPLAAGLFAFVGHELRAPVTSSAERVLWVGWLALALHGRRLGLPGFLPLMAAALALLLAWRISRWLPSLRRSLGERAGRWPTWPFAVLPLAVGLALLPWIHGAHEPDGDEPYFLLLTESLVSDFDFDLADEYRDNAARRFTERAIEPQPGDWHGPDGEQRSRHESLLVFYLAPFWLAGGVAGARVGMLLVWALFAERSLALTRAAGASSRGALGAWVVTAFAAPVVVYASQIWVETAAGLAFAVGLERWLSWRGVEPEGTGKRDVAFGAALLALPLLKLRLLALALPLALARLVERRRRRADWLVLAALAALAALVLWRNDRLVGRALGIYLASDFLPVAVDPERVLLGLDGLLFDLAFGLFAAAPVWLAALGGVQKLFERRGIVGFALLAAVPYVVLVVSLRSWYGGWSPPFRYGVVLLPIAAVALSGTLGRRSARAEKLVYVALGMISAVVALAWTIQPGWATSFADGRSRIVDLAAAPFAADVARLLPSALRPRPATWIAPLVAVGALWLARRDRRHRLRAPPLAAAAAIFALFVAAVVAAHRLPTRVAQAEDLWVAKSMGELYPAPWTVDRTREIGGLSLGPNDASLEIVPIPGGATVSIRITFRPHPSNQWAAVLIVTDSKDVELARFRVTPWAGWSTEALAEREWTPGERLRLEVAVGNPDPAKTAVALVVDRVEFDWH